MNFHSRISFVHSGPLCSSDHCSVYCIYVCVHCSAADCMQQSHSAPTAHLIIMSILMHQWNSWKTLYFSKYVDWYDSEMLLNTPKNWTSKRIKRIDRFRQKQNKLPQKSRLLDWAALSSTDTHMNIFSFKYMLTKFSEEISFFVGEIFF